MSSGHELRGVPNTAGRPADPDSDDDLSAMAVCHCGSAWFVLTEPGEICLDTTGKITGYHGRIVCVECASEWVPPRGRLKAVHGLDASP
jgi:hypothetical protein